MLTVMNAMREAGLAAWCLEFDKEWGARFRALNNGCAAVTVSGPPYSNSFHALNREAVVLPAPAIALRVSTINLARLPSAA